MSAILFNGTLTASFQATKAVMVSAAELAFTVDLELTVAGAPTSVVYYLEFGEDPSPAGKWYREIAEEDAGGGVVAMPFVLRTLQPNAGGNLPVGITRVDAEFKRRHKLARVQIASPGNVKALITTPFGRAI